MLMFARNRRIAMQTLKLGLYAAAFGIGFVVGPLLIRHLSSPPVLSGGASEHVPRVVAPTPAHLALAPDVFPLSAGLQGKRLGTSRQAADTRQRAAASARPSPDHTSRPVATTHSPLQSTVVSPPTPVHQTPTGRPPSTAVASKPATSVPGTDPSLSFVITPAADTPATAGAAQGAAQETPRFHIQAGVFTSQEQAQALVQRLQSLGYVATSSNEGDVYRVWVGGYFDRETAERLAAIIRKAGFDAVLVP